LGNLHFDSFLVVQVSRHLMVKPSVDTQRGLMDLFIVRCAADVAFGSVVKGGVVEHDSFHNDSVLDVVLWQG
jgi:hypothetical protein